MEATDSKGDPPKKREDRFRRALRDELMTRLRERGIDATEFAEMTGLLPAGAHALMERKDWSLSTCLRVADSLDVEILPRVSDREDAPA